MQGLKGRPAGKTQIGRPAARGEGLGLVSGRGPVGRPHAPVRGPLGTPEKTAMRPDMDEGPAQVVRDIGGDAKLTAGLDDPEEFAERRGIYQPAAVVARLWPRIGVEDEERDLWLSGASRSSRQRASPSKMRILAADPASIPCTSLAMPLRNTSAATKPVSRIGRSDRHQVLATAEPDFHPHFHRTLGKKGEGVEAAQRRQIDPQTGQESVDERLPPAAQRLCLAPAIELVAAGSGHGSVA